MVLVRGSIQSSTVSLLVWIRSFERASLQDHSGWRTDHDLDAGVRSAGPLVAFDACCGTSRYRPAGSPGAVALKGALGCLAGAGGLSADCCRSVPHAYW